MPLDVCLRDHRCATGAVLHAGLGNKYVCRRRWGLGRLQLTFGGDGRHVEARSVWLGERLGYLQA
jgi:hypothetical protein